MQSPMLVALSFALVLWTGQVAGWCRWHETQSDGLATPNAHANPRPHLL